MTASVRDEKTCPLPNSHTRLRQVHTLWHEAAQGYAVPDLFVPRLNALLQAARSVTWVLQKEMSRDEDFDAWYGSWQERMRGDERMRWLVEARNKIEKQGDLEMHSVAKVRLVANAWTGPTVEFGVPPHIGPTEIAMATELKSLPSEVRESGLLEVERRWVVPEQPDYEVLDLVAHCYGVLAQLLVEAHIRRGVAMQTFGEEDHENRRRRRPHPTGRLDCMLIGREQRTARWHLGHEALIELEARQIEWSDAEREQTRAHYDDMSEWPKTSPDAPFADQAKVWHEWGKRMLIHDGGHRTMAMLLADEGASYLDVTPEDDQGKWAMMSQIAIEIDRVAATEMIFTTEAWFALDVPEGDPRFGVRARDREDHVDVLMTYAISRDGTRIALSSEYELVDGTPVFTDPEPIELSTDFETQFTPVLEVWARWPSESGSAASKRD
jgi:hypothetical protein